MRVMKKMLATMLAAIVAMVSGLTVFAATTGTITITPPAGTTGTNTYKVYKVFDAVGNGTNISYKVMAGKTGVPAGFKVDAQGNVSYDGGSGVTELTPENIEAIKTYIAGDQPVKTVTTNGTTPAVVTGLENGYYYITTTTGTVVTIDSTNPDAQVEDKNTVPTVDKKITGANSIDDDGKKALAQVGTNVNFTSTITVGKGAVDYTFHDKMDSRLSYNNDVQVKVNGALVDASNYDTTPAAGDTLTISFHNDYISTLSEGTKILVSYSAKITAAALSLDPAKNTATLGYGHKDSQGNNPNTTPPSETETYNAKFTVTKHDGKGKPLAGAGFVLKNAAGKYYKIDSNVVTWVDNIDDATEYKSDETGAVPAFIGLANGTYTLVEKTVPAGYNKAADVVFTVDEHDYTSDNLEQKATVVNNAGPELPSTGSIGTRLFYIIGGLLLVVAGTLLVTRKRMTSE